jgi:hypothetical protein
VLLLSRPLRPKADMRRITAAPALHSLLPLPELRVRVAAVIDRLFRRISPGPAQITQVHMNDNINTQRNTLCASIHHPGAKHNTKCCHSFQSSQGYMVARQHLGPAQDCVDTHTWLHAGVKGPLDGHICRRDSCCIIRPAAATVARGLHQLLIRVAVQQAQELLLLRVLRTRGKGVGVAARHCI